MIANFPQLHQNVDDTHEVTRRQRVLSAVRINKKLCTCKCDKFIRLSVSQNVVKHSDLYLLSITVKLHNNTYRGLSHETSY